MGIINTTENQREKEKSQKHDRAVKQFLLLWLAGFILGPQRQWLHPSSRLLPAPGLHWCSRGFRIWALKGNHSQIHTLLLASCVTLNKLLNLSEPQLPACINRMYFMVLWGIGEIVLDNHLGWSVRHMVATIVTWGHWSQFRFERMCVLLGWLTIQMLILFKCDPSNHSALFICRRLASP